MPSAKSLFAELHSLLGLKITLGYAASAGPTAPGKRGPKATLDDATLLALIRADLAASPFRGEGHRKVFGRPPPLAARPPPVRPPGRRFADIDNPLGADPGRMFFRERTAWLLSCG